MNTFVTQIVKRVVEQIREANALALYRYRCEFGGNRTLASCHPDEWVSFRCSALDCEHCPSDRYHLQCQCNCHVRKVRS